MRGLMLSAAVLALTLPSAWAGDMSMPMTHSAHAASPAKKANAAAMHTMMQAMTVKPTGNPDKDFALTMIGHHQGAIAMAKVELQYGQDPELKTLAQDIVTAQEKEIAQMKAWVAAHP